MIVTSARTRVRSYVLRRIDAHAVAPRVGGDLASLKKGFRIPCLFSGPEGVACDIVPDVRKHDDGGGKRVPSSKGEISAHSSHGWQEEGR